MLVDVTGLYDFEELFEILKNYVENLLKNIEILLTMETFTIGKIYAISKERCRQTFSGTNSADFTTTGIANRF